MNHSQQLLITPRAYGTFLNKIVELGEHTSPRGIGTTELVNATCVLRNPIDRVVPSAARRNNIAFGIAEWVSLMTGIDDISFFTRFIKSYDRFTSDGEHLDGCYGTRVNYHLPPPGLNGWLPTTATLHSQIVDVERKLMEDPDTRQAVIALYQREDLIGLGGTNTPCTLTFQFLQRDRHLHMLVNMRSSDAIKGLTYDVFMFTMLQEYLARRLHLKLGYYMHHAGSLHVYDSDLPMVKAIAAAPRWPLLMDPMPALERDDLRELGWLALNYVERPGDLLGDIESTRVEFSTPAAHHYLTQLLAVMVAFVGREELSHAETRRLFSYVRNRTLRTVLRQRLEAAGVKVTRGAA